MTTFAYSSFIKVVILMILIALWPLAMPYAQPMKLIGQYYLAMFVYPFFPYSLFLAFMQFSIFLLSWRIFLWIVAPQAGDIDASSATSNNSSGFNSSTMSNG